MRVIKFVAATLLIVIGVVLLKAILSPSRQISVTRLALQAGDEAGAAERLAGAVRLCTISRDDDPDAAGAELLHLHRYLEESYPRLHQSLKREEVARYSLLFTWPGSDPSLAPVVLMAHQDVVPIAVGT